ncbi:WD repeat-containing protein 46 [Neocloeon triangulifer]|uniref:WD repeat-containing protein 46 n=1 Tax=Neocloeon triangulifer TaxID=2078957 RepID=UPI00286F0361|nr:WD repeat-containing protein 46 [Neocloeon triangulifer]XP_059484661.1 WD repeat-containing protein 46 [Neocloeon triangulifer]XP_059484663.1 WD repeat-containing protein 46 [Neocloeon triangulifer]XP_059484664.1 WD repeat-containing protein 46 [Neocloeon triangulifer]
MKSEKPKKKHGKKFNSSSAMGKSSDLAQAEGQDSNPNRAKRRKNRLEPNAEAKKLMKFAQTKIEDGKKPALEKRAGPKKDEKEQVLKPPIIDQKILEKYSRGTGVSIKSFKQKTFRKRLESKEKKIKFFTEEAARNELLLTEDAGFLEPEGYEETAEFTQKQIVKAVDITSATKHFELNLEFGPYRIDYTRNGRNLLLGGRRGHVAAFDWVTKRLMCEINVMEDVMDLKWLHSETMFATAQKDWVYIYDNEGSEIHCIKQMHKVLRMEYLPYHFLLAAASETGHLNWLDVSIGKMVAGFNAKMGRLPHMAQNPFNGTVVLGHPTGVVSLWSPMVKEPLAKMLCQKTGIMSMAVDPAGKYIASCGMDRNMNIWDIRAMKPLQSYRTVGVPTSLSLSHKGCLAAGNGDIVQVYKDCINTPVDGPYLTFKCKQWSIKQVQFCPFEDVLGIGAERGFSSILVPGSGEANFDSYEQNPFRTKSQRKEAEVKSLLEKIPAELITLDPLAITEVDIPTLHEKVEAQKKLLYMRPPKIDYNPRRKNKKGGGVQAAKTRKILQEEAKKDFIKLMKDNKPDLLTPIGGKSSNRPAQPPSVLDRFKAKPKKKSTPVDG